MVLCSLYIGTSGVRGALQRTWTKTGLYTEELTIFRSYKGNQLREGSGERPKGISSIPSHNWASSRVSKSGKTVLRWDLEAERVCTSWGGSSGHKGQPRRMAAVFEESARSTDAKREVVEASGGRIGNRPSLI